MKFISVKSLMGGALVSCLASLALLVIIWHLSTPASSGPLGILVVFLLIYVFFTSLALILTSVWSFVSSRIRHSPGLNGRRRYYVSSVLGFLPVLYLTLLSMGGVSVWGIILIAMFIGLMLFYVLRRSA